MKHRVIGLMSGTSLDGVDACCIDVEWQKTAPFETIQVAVVATTSLPFSSELKQTLLGLQGSTKQSVSQTVASICQVNIQLSHLYAQTVLQLLNQHNLQATEIDYIGCHGQTIWHQPALASADKSTLVFPSTLQLGDVSTLAQLTGINTVGNFRSADMAVGGQGAPLVCLADQLLFQTPAKTRVIHNLGGISNLTVLPAVERSLPLMAFDTGPANSLIDLAMQRFYNKPYDVDGKIAALGKVNQALLTQWMSEPYFVQKPPKTTGRELFGVQFLDKYTDQLNRMMKEDVIATVSALTINSIVHAYQQFVFNQFNVDEIIWGGGGTNNSHYLSLLQTALTEQNADVKFSTHQTYGIDNQYKEALAFGLLAWANQNNLPGNITSCTGAQKAVILGQIAVV